MAKAKTTTVSKKQPATAPSPAKSAARKPEVATAPSRAPLPSKADVQPDVSVGALVLHSERLVKTAATHADELTTAKVTAADRRELSARIAALREAEAAWKKARVASAPGAVAKGRAALTLGREDLLGALRAFADHDEATQLALDAVGSVDDDDDLEADVEALVRWPAPTPPTSTGPRSPPPTSTRSRRCSSPFAWCARACGPTATTPPPPRPSRRRRSRRGGRATRPSGRSLSSTARCPGGRASASAATPR